MSGRLGGSVATPGTSGAGSAGAQVRVDPAAVKKMVLRQSDELPMPEISFRPSSKPVQTATEVPAFEALLSTVDRTTDLAEASGSSDLAAAARQLRVEMANLRLEVQYAAEEIRRLRESIHSG